MTVDERLAPVLAAVDEYGLDCADRAYLPYKYGDTEDRQASDEWAAVRDAIVALMVGELEATNADAEREMLTTHVLEGAHGRAIAKRLAEWRAAREAETPAE